MFLSATTAPAGPIVLADTPLVNGLTSNIAPNILFILDDSLSMESDYMPDGVNADDDEMCFRNFGYNTIYYNPNETYELPVNSDGTPFDPADPGAAYDDGFLPDDDDITDLLEVDIDEDTTSATDTNLVMPNNPFRALSVGSRVIRVTYNNHGLEATEPYGSSFDRVRFTRTSGTSNWNVFGATVLYDQWYDVTAVIDANTFTITTVAGTATSTTATGGNNVRLRRQDYTTTHTETPVVYYSSYTANPGSPPSTCELDPTYTAVYIANESAAQQQNYANWYQYYRTRLLLMKSAAGRAFLGVNSDFRVGFSVISDTGTNADLFLGVNRFTGTHKEDWYDMLYGIEGAAFTPLRGALSKAGRYYAGRLGSPYNAGATSDPIQYSCQQNFSILTTDGYWNVDNESPRAADPDGFGPLPRPANTTDGMAVGLASANYGPFGIDNVTRVGNADNGESAPFGDTVSNTLADVAAYYYKTDLRPNAGVGGVNDDGDQIDVSENNVPQTDDDGRTHQRMQTFTLGMGLDGTRSYPGDWAAIVDGSLAWPNPITNHLAQRIDDLWHAAVNGRGQYMSAKNAGAVEDQLNDALASIRYEKGSAAAAATSTLQPVDGDNTAFLAQYETGHWVGNLLARTIDEDTGEISGTNLWSAQTVLDGMVEADDDDRTIYTYSAAETNGLKSFEAANLTTEIAAGYFRSDGFAGHAELTQHDDWTSDQVSAATSQAMIKFLRGQTGNEMSDADPLPDNEVFRDRQHILGDIGSAAPVYVRKPPFTYTDDGYAAFVGDQEEREATVYVGANDGMLHAFNGTDGVGGGTERWAYIPSMVLPNLYKLADAEYATNHRYFVDGPIALGDARDPNTDEWATILVGGLGHGGKGYYALDVTDPDSPKALWEFTTADDNDIGYSYGNPIITKRASDGTWVVLFASGYNNGTPGDGKGRLFMVDAFTGTKLLEIITDDLETDESLSGIARISNYVEDGLRDNRTQYVYGGDLSGNLWRFDINVATCNECATAAARVLLARTTSTSDAGVQPITVQPELARIRDGAGSWHRVVYFGTGRALGPNDITDLDPSNGEAQAVYAVKDTGTYLGVLTDAGANLVSHTMREPTEAEIEAGNSSRRMDSPTPVNWQLHNGWYITTPDSERFTVDPGLQLGTLVIAANIHEQGYCEPTGSTVLYQLDYKSGVVLKTTAYGAQIVGITQLQTRGGAGPVVIDPVFADGTTGNVAQAGSSTGGGSATRVSWREIE
jgi:type IV pilus assembly protein PilY1